MWPDSADRQKDRVRLISEALRPASTTDSWAEGLKGVDLAAAVSGLKLCAVDDQAEEARIIALLMREALEVEGKTAALVTPDRALARRVSIELSRWGIGVDDSAGIPLNQTPVWIFLTLIGAAAEARFSPVELLALLKSPFALCGAEQARHQQAVAALERFCLRGPRPRPGLAGLRHRLDGLSTASDARPRPGQSALADMAALIDRIETAYRPLTDLMARESALLSDWAEAHIAVAEGLSSEHEGGRAHAMWSGKDGEAAARAIASLAETGDPEPVGYSDYRDVVDQVAAGKAVRPYRSAHPRLAIWGPLEARLQSADLMILGGLTEETWPQRPQSGPWVNLAMRKAAGLSEPERFIGLSAHDFQELAAGPEVVLTVPGKVEGQPALASRWVLRLENYLKGRSLAKSVELDESYAQWAGALDRPASAIETPKPEPCPPLSLRPRTFRVTEIETLLRDPYAIFARHVLGLKKLDPVDERRGPRHLGIVLHTVMERFIEENRADLGPNAGADLIRLGKDCIDAETDDPFEQEIWLSRLKRAAAKIIEWERRHREGFLPLALEVGGELSLSAPGGPVQVRGRADRIDRSLDGRSLAILDYKTGAVPTVKQVEVGLRPQLTLEALMAQRAGFAGVEALPVTDLVYLQIGGAGGLVERRIGRAVGDLAMQTLAGLQAVLERYDNPQTPYLSCRCRNASHPKGIMISWPG